jgi:uncharacterized protein (DUF885 family)
MPRYPMHRVVLILIAFGLTACEQASEPAEEAVVDVQAQLTQLYHEYDEEQLALNPVFAMFRGDYRFNDQWFPHDPLTDEYAAAAYDIHKRYLARLSEIDPSTLDVDDHLTYDMFKFDRENAIERQDLGFNDFELLTPVSQFFSVPNMIVRIGSGAAGQPFDTPVDFDAWIKRSTGFVNHVDLSITKMREGVELGVVQPRVLMEKALPQLAAQLVDDPEQSDFWIPVARMSEDFSDEERARIESAYREHISDVLVPAFAKLHDYINDEYLKYTRDSVGQSEVPGGKEYYAFMVRETTTTDYTPEEIHEIGKREAKRIYAEMERVKEEVGFEGDMQAFFTHLRNDPQYYYDDEQALLDDYDALRHKINPALGKIFDVQPKTDYIVLPVEAFRAKSMAAAQYFMGTPDGSRPGVFYVNTYDLGARPNYVMEALSLHEASPGHHFQISIKQEVGDLPAFRRFNSYTAFEEGWGLYAESLGKELGLYTDPLQYFGALHFDIWRANRLVVDTGMHALGWTREEAIEWMMANQPITDTDVVAEVERYIAIPSQALAYKIGQMKIRELRTRAEEALGEKFDVREFHNQVLTTGSLPLVVLEAKIDRWIESQKG